MTRIRVTGGPWPERVGLEGSLVEPTEYRDEYPYNGLMRDEVIILLDDDPVGAALRSTAARFWVEHPEWTCIIKRSNIEVTA